MNLQFEWDADKASQNVRKHGVSFQEAITVFNDELSLTIPDLDHSTTEFRFIDMGVSKEGRLLVVAYTELHQVIRIISARKVTKRERKAYEEGT